MDTYTHVVCDGKIVKYIYIYKFRKEEGIIQKIGGRCSEKRRAVFRK